MAGMRCGSDTIWGPAQAVGKLDGIPAWSVETAGHGGYAVEAEWAERNLTPPALAVAGPEELGCYWFEEDVDWAVPILDSSVFAEAAAAEWRRASVLPAEEVSVESLVKMARGVAERWQKEYLRETGR